MTDARSAAVRLHDVGKSYCEGSTEHPVLEGVDLMISRGEFVALLGPSGSGKSTLLNLVGGIDLPSRGSVVVGGVALERLSEKRRTVFRRHHVGLVFQFFNLIPTLTVEENLLLPLDLAADLRPQTRDAARDLLDRVGLLDRASSFPDRLSGGEQQRVAIVRALVTNPDIVLADEPTGNLDQETGDRVLDLLTTMLRPSGAALLMATHSRAVAARADRVVRLSDGRVEPAPLPQRP